MKRLYGWKRDLHDERDHLFVARTRLAVPSSDLRSGYPLAPFDQGQLGSCTAFGFAGVVTFEQSKQGLPITMPSCLYQYYNTRILESTTGEDSGGTIRDAIKAGNRYGVCSEATWPYVIGNFTQQPPDPAYAEGGLHPILQYHRVIGGVDGIRLALSSGYPVDFGMLVYESFESDTVAQSGVIPMPGPGENVAGGHCTNLCGHDDTTRMFLGRNSWGTGWGQNGYYQISYDYIDQYASDFWVVSLVK